MSSVGSGHVATPLTPAEHQIQIQLLNVRRRVHHGAIIRGHRVGLSSRAMQQMMDVSQPDYGRLLSDMFIAENTAMNMSTLCSPRLEVEIAFVLAEALPAPGMTLDANFAHLGRVGITVAAQAQGRLTR